MPNLPLLLGHRGTGFSALVAENSFAAFDTALEHGCDGFEFDVRVTGCGRAVVCHAASIRGVTVARAQADQLTGLPVLEDVLQRYGANAFLDIELKVGGIESKVLTALREHPPERGFVVSSFIPKVVLELQFRSATVPTGIICEKPGQLARARSVGTGFVIVHSSLLDRELVREFQETGKKIIVWTVNDKNTMLRHADWGVDGIISDDTQLLVRTFYGDQPRSRGKS
jgi:glycerophosphoryl diester phosphodiesterase